MALLRGSTSNRVLSLLLLGLCLALYPGCGARAQAASQAQKIDEFGDIQRSDLLARLDAFAVHLQNEPNARGFIIVYRTKRDLPGLSSRLANLMRSYLVNTRGISADRVITVDGVASCLTQELWIVPVGHTDDQK